MLGAEVGLVIGHLHVGGEVVSDRLYIVEPPAPQFTSFAERYGCDPTFTGQPVQVCA